MGAPGHQRLLVGAAAATYVAVFVAFTLLERPGLGVGHVYYVAIALLALARGGVWGALGGVVAVCLYVAGTLLNTDMLNAELLEVGTAIRAVTFVVMGTLIGWYATHYRAALGELAVLAERDTLTGLPNTRAFERAIDRRLADGRPFALLVGDVNRLAGVNESGSRLAGDDAVRQVSALLLRALRPDDDVARVGADEFAILTPCASPDDAPDLARRLERLLGHAGSSVTFGWSSFPAEGENALSLYRVADERLYARKVMLGEPGRNLVLVR